MKNATQAPTPRLVLKLLGRPQIDVLNQTVTRAIKYRKGMALIGYLAAHAGIWQSRESLADLFWPGLELSAARTNLRQVLNNLGAILDTMGHPLALQRDDQAVCLIAGAGVRIDIALLSDATLNRIVADAPDSRRWRQEEIEPLAHSLGEEFLEGLHFASMPDFNEWLEATRRYFRKRGILLIEHICRAQHNEGRLDAAIDTARHLIRLNPFDENATLTLMLLQAEAGDGTGALEAFSVLQQRLESELGLAPGKRLLTLCDDIRQGASTNFSLLNRSETSGHELRWLVAMYCDLGSYPDVANAVDNGLIEHLLELGQRHGGTLASLAGQGLLLVFGLGEGVERAAERALLAAGEIIGKPADPCPIRIGICSGQVLFKTQANLPHLLGRAPDLARQLSWAAASGKVLVSESLLLQAGKLFQFTPLGERSFPGQEGLHKLFEVAGLSARGDTRQSSPDAKMRPFAGRREEMERLQALWSTVLKGDSRIAVLRAPAGLGKTRLISEFAHWVGQQGGTPHPVTCRLELQHQPLAALLAGLGLLAESPPKASAEAARESLGRRLQQRFSELDPATIALLQTLGESGKRPPAPDLAAKSTVFSAIIAALESLIARSPSLLIIDDFHWSDLATRELLSIFAHGLSHQKILLVITSRPEVSPDCPAALSEYIELPPMSESEALELIESSDPEGRIPLSERQRIAQTGGGIPLFVEHLIKGWQEGEHHLLPITELLQRELDLLGPARAVLRAAAILGSNFRRQDLIELLPDSNVAAALSRARHQGLIETNDGGVFSFQHNLILETAYNSTPPAYRRRLHKRVARQLEQQAAPPAEEVARHFSAAHCWQEAAQWWLTAGASAMAREFAFDAQACFEKALDMLAALDGEVDVNLVWSTRLQLGHAAQVSQGFGSPLAHRLFSEVAGEIEKEAASGSEHRENLFAALSGKYMGGSSQGEIEGLQIARRLADMAQSETERLMACFALGNSLFWRGELLEARLWQECGIALADRLPAKERIRYCVDDAAITCRAFYAWNLWFLGDETAACAMLEEGLGIARKGGRSHALCFIMTFAIAVHWCRGALDQVIELGNEALALSRRYAFPLWEGVNLLFLLAAQARSGALTDTAPLFAAAAQMQQAYQAGITTSRWIASDALMAQGEWEEAEKLLNLAIREADFNEDMYCLPDLLWRMGQCVNRRSTPDQAAPYFAQARDLAQSLRATGLLRHFADQTSEAMAGD